MSDVPGAVLDPLIQAEEVKFKAAVSEYTSERMAGILNLIQDSVLCIAKFNLNGAINFFTGVAGADGIFTVPWNATITDAVIIGGRTAGTSSSTEIDVQVSTFPNGAWTSIFSTIPTLAPAAAAFASCGIGDTVTGATAGILTSSPDGFSVSAKDRIRINVASAMGGQLDGSMEVHLKLR